MADKRLQDKEHAAGGALTFPLADEAEARQIAEMRKELAADLSAMRCGAWPDVTGDVRLLRFLRGFDNDVNKAVAAVRDLLQIRKKYRMDEAHEKYASLDCSHLSPFPHQAVIDRCKPGLPTVGLSRTGLPVCYEPLRYHKYAKTLDEIGEDGVVEFYVAQCEARNMQLHLLSEQQRQLTKLLLIIDLRAVSLWQLTSRRWAKFDETHQTPINRTLAEVIGRIYVINCPRWVTSWYKRIEWWIPPKTRGKIRLLGTDFRPELLQVIEPKVLQAMLSWRPVHEVGDEGGADGDVQGIGDCESQGEERATIGAGKALERELLVGPSDTVRWRFSVLSIGDVEFSLVALLPTGVEEVLGTSGDRTMRSTNDEASGETTLVAKRRHISSDGEVSGSFVMPKFDGGNAAETSVDEAPSCLVIARWSNLHSWMRSKGVRLTLTVEPSKSDDLQPSSSIENERTKREDVKLEEVAAAVDGVRLSQFVQ